MASFITGTAWLWLVAGTLLARAFNKASQREGASEDEKGGCSAAALVCLISLVPTAGWLLARYFPRVF